LAKGEIVMSGPRQTLAVVEGNGRKHLSKSEKAERAASEVNLEVKAPTTPNWLSAEQQRHFRKIAGQLKDAGLISKLDGDSLARYVVAMDFWKQATFHVEGGFIRGDVSKATDWSAVQDRYYKQARNAAVDMGLTITSRCRLVLPEGGQSKPQESAFERLMREKEKRQNNA